MKKAIIISVLSLVVLGTMLLWLFNSDSAFRGSSSIMVVIQVVILVFAVLVVVKRWTAAKQKLPAEDEMSRQILLRSTAASYHVSLYMWLALMFFEERIDLERSTLIGAGILGMAIIFGLSWVYFNFVKRSHE